MRVKRIMSQHETSLEEAEFIVKESDKVRVTFVEEFYKVPWDSIHAFDMVINTGKVSPDLAANWIVNAVKSPIPSLEINKPTTTSIVIDHILAKAVSEELNCSQMHK